MLCTLREHAEQGRKIRMNKHLTEELARKLLEALRGHHLGAIITLAVVTGMRRDELLSLQWQDIDMEKHKLLVRNSKTKSSYRMIHFPEDITEVLEQHRLRQMEARLEAGTAWHDLDLVFPLEPDQLLKGFHEILEEAALPPLLFHELRAARWRALREQLRLAKEGLDGAQAGYLDLSK